jgi:hypothetical protein
LRLFIKTRKGQARKGFQGFEYKGGNGGLDLRSLFFFGIADSGVRGGGKCPEEEHTTCSGGPRILFSQARFMGRGIILYSIK